MTKNSYLWNFYFYKTKKHDKGSLMSISQQTVDIKVRVGLELQVILRRLSYMIIPVCNCQWYVAVYINVQDSTLLAKLTSLCYDKENISGPARPPWQVSGGDAEILNMIITGVCWIIMSFIWIWSCWYGSWSTKYKVVLKNWLMWVCKLIHSVLW